MPPAQAPPAESPVLLFASLIEATASRDFARATRYRRALFRAVWSVMPAPRGPAIDEGPHGVEVARIGAPMSSSRVPQADDIKERGPGPLARSRPSKDTPSGVIRGSSR